MSKINTDRIGTRDGTLDIDVKSIMVRSDAMENLGDYEQGIELAHAHEFIVKGDSWYTAKTGQAPYVLTGVWEYDKERLEIYGAWDHSSLKNRDKEGSHSARAISYDHGSIFPDNSLGKELQTLKNNSSDYQIVDSFEQGATITGRNQALQVEADGRLYRWAGDLPKIVPSSSTPENTGGVQNGAWLEVSEPTLRQELASRAGGSLVGGTTKAFVDFNAASLEVSSYVEGAQALISGVAVEKRNNQWVNSRPDASPATGLMGVKYIAHRGASRFAPENTLPSFDLAADMGFWGVETDIRLTSDNKWVLIHDNSVTRVTGEGGVIGDYTLEQTRAFDAGSWISVYYQGTQIPTLEDFLDLCRLRGLTPFMEVKEGVYNTAALQNLVDTCIKFFGDYGFYIITTVEDVMRQIRSMDSNVHLQYVIGPYSEEAVDLCVSIGNCGISCYFAGIPDSLEYARQRGVLVNCWTVNLRHDADIATNKGVSFITSDYINNN